MVERYEEMMRNRGFLPFHRGFLDEERTEKARKELNETDDNRGSAIAELRKKAQEVENFKCPTNDEYLLQYLRARKFDVKRAFNLLQTFYQVKKDYPECFSKFDYDQLQTLAASGAGSYLPYRSPDGCAILLLEFNKWNCQQNDVIDVMTMLGIILLYACEDPATQVCGLRVVLNVKGATWRQITSITPRYILLLSKALRNCMPCRFKGIHIFNESAIFQVIWRVLKLFLTEKIKQRVHFHGTSQKQLHKHIPKEILTEEYGGANSYFNNADFCVNMLRDFRPTVEQLLLCGFQE